MVSWEFLSSEIGRALLKAKFEVGNDVYFIMDLAKSWGAPGNLLVKK